MVQLSKYIPNANTSNAIATIILAIVGVVGISLTQRSLELAERAWLSPIGAQLTTPLEKDQPIHFSISVINSGREPATGFVMAIKNYKIDGFDPKFTDMSDVVVPVNNSCDGLFPVEGHITVAPSTKLDWNADSGHGVPQLRADDRIIKGEKFYVAEGCIAYRSYGATRRSSFCYVMQRTEAFRSNMPPNIVANPTPTPSISVPGQPNTVPPAAINPQSTGENSGQTRIGDAYVFINCAKGFASD